MALNSLPTGLFRLQAVFVPVRYSFDLLKLLVGLLPYLLRKPRLKAYIEALVAPVLTIYGDFISLQARTKRELSYNGQTLNFQRALNDRFDPVLARIRIVNSDATFDAVYVNFVAETEPPKFTKFTTESPPHFMLYTTAEVAGQIGFVVRCPASLRPQEPALKARISQLKLALVKYRLQYV